MGYSLQINYSVILAISFPAAFSCCFPLDDGYIFILLFECVPWSNLGFYFTSQLGHDASVLRWLPEAHFGRAEHLSIPMGFAVLLPHSASRF
jgi:hypothetical protein